MKVIFWTTVAVLLALGNTPAQGVTEGQAERLATQVCAGCHGRDGNSISPLFPRLAGQPPQYMEAQLKSFRDRTRADPPAMAYMWGMASQLDDETIKDLASYYASRAPRAIPTSQIAPASLGKEIYERGLGTHGAPSCLACHGAAAQGSGPIPRLAGQHREYLAKQLAFFKTKLRGNHAVMAAVCAELTVEQMQAVATYAASR
jgi:cytochrome c553